MAEAQHGSSTKHGTNITGKRQQHKGQEGKDNNTSCEAARTVSKHVHDWVFEWRDERHAHLYCALLCLYLFLHFFFSWEVSLDSIERGSQVQYKTLQQSLLMVTLLDKTLLSTCHLTDEHLNRTDHLLWCTLAHMHSLTHAHTQTDIHTTAQPHTHTHTFLLHIHHNCCYQTLIMIAKYCTS